MMCSTESTIDILQKILNGLRSLVGGSADHTKFLVSFQDSKCADNTQRHEIVPFSPCKCRE